MPEKFHTTHEDHNQWRAVATGFHKDTTELEVQHLLNETITAITHAFIHFSDNDEMVKYVRSANMSKKEVRGRKNKNITGYGRRREVSSKKTGIHQMLHWRKHNMPLSSISMIRVSRHISVHGQIVVRTCQSGSLKCHKIPWRYKSGRQNSSQRLWAVAKRGSDAGQKTRPRSVKRVQRTSEDQENKKRNRKGGGRQKFKNVDGDVPMCMKINVGRTGEFVKECKKTKGKGGGRRELRHVPLSMRNKGKEEEEDSSRAKRESSSENWWWTNWRNCERMRMLLLLFSPKKQRSMNSSDRIEEMIKEIEDYSWDAILMEIIQSRDLGDSKITHFLWRSTVLQSCWTRNGDIELSTLITSANVPFQQRTNKNLCRWVCASPTRDMQTTTSKDCLKQSKSTREAKEYFRSLEETSTQNWTGEGHQAEKCWTTDILRMWQKWRLAETVVDDTLNTIYK